MSVIDEYLTTLNDQEKSLIEHMYQIVRDMVPDATEEMSYAMPSFKYKGKSLVAIMARENFVSLYPFGTVEKLGVNLSAFETTSGSIHFSAENPLSDELLRGIIAARMRQIDRKA